MMIPDLRSLKVADMAAIDTGTYMKAATYTSECGIACLL